MSSNRDIFCMILFIKTNLEGSLVARQKNQRESTLSFGDIGKNGKLIQ